MHPNFARCSSSGGYVRLNNNGSFDFQSEFYSPVNTLILQSDGKIIVGGEFKIYDNTIRNRITRLINCPNVSISPNTISNGIAGQSYTPITFTQAGLTGTITWSATGLPEGISLNSNTGVLSGIPTQEGEFEITIIAASSNGCYATQKYIFSVGDPNALYNYDSSFKVYPNPTRDKFRIESNITNFEYDILDAQGRKLESNKKGNSNEEISLLPYSSGLYMLRIRSSQGTTTLKVSKW
jgi:hypothetical protein